MCKRTYMTLLNDSDQGMLDTVFVTEHALQQLHIDEPQIENVAFKNDGASCYEGNPFFSSLLIFLASSGSYIVFNTVFHFH